jgi:MSHA biogenesis protein MshJ
MFTIWNEFLMTPIEAEQKKLVIELNNKNAERFALVTRFQELIKTNSENPDADNIAKLKNLRSRLVDVQADLETSTGNLVSAKDMAKILETVLHKTGGLTLLKLESLGVSPLIVQEGTDAKVNSNKKENVNADKKLTADNIDNAYKHGLRIEFQGSYLTTLNYLKSLEDLEWGFFWDNFQLTVNEYPEANASIEIFTLSLKKEWIDV